MANSTASLLPDFVLTFESYWLGANICSNNKANCTSPTPPRNFTLLNIFFNPPTSVAKVCISPNPRWTSMSCLPTVSKLWPKRSLSVLSSFSSTVERMRSRFDCRAIFNSDRFCCAVFAASWRLIRKSSLRFDSSLLIAVCNSVSFVWMIVPSLVGLGRKRITQTSSTNWITAIKRSRKFSMAQS